MDDTDFKVVATIRSDVGAGGIESEFGIVVCHDVCKGSHGASRVLAESFEARRRACSCKVAVTLQSCN